jgi:hypothetical protein
LTTEEEEWLKIELKAGSSLGVTTLTASKAKVDITYPIGGPDYEELSSNPRQVQPPTRFARIIIDVFPNEDNNIFTIQEEGPVED